MAVRLPSPVPWRRVGSHLNDKLVRTTTERLVAAAAGTG